MKNTTYTVQFFHGGEGIWKNAGLHTYTELDEARKAAKAQAEMTDFMVSFRVEKTTTF